MRRATVSAVSLLATATLALSACGGGDDGGGPDTGGNTDVKSMATGKAQDAERFRLAEVGSFDQVTVAIDEGYSGYNNETPDTNTSYNTFVLVSVLAGAHMYDGNNKVLLNADVMESVTVTSPDPQVVEWKIKPGVTWSDGGTWDCDDFYLAWLARTGTIESFVAAETQGYDLVGEASCTDDLTFEARFREPYLDYRSMFEPAHVLPAHVLEQQTGVADITALKPGGDAEALAKAGDFWTQEWKGFNPDTMPGSGPYRITAFDQNSKTVTLEKNPNWIGAKGGPNKIIIRPIPDTKAMATALQNGEVDVIGSVQPDATAAATLRGLTAQGVLYGSASRLSFEHLDLNFNRLFADEAARRAFFQLVNRQEIAEKLIKPVQDDAQPLNSLIYFPGEEGFVDNYSDKVNQGVEAAARTLEEGGWARGADGIFAKDGQRFSVRISHNQNARRSQTVEIIQAQARNAGMEILDDTDPNFLKGRLDKGDYDIALFGWSSAPFKVATQAIYSTGGGSNYQGLSDPRIDEALQKAVSATDRATAVKAYQEADRLIAERYASLPLFQTPSMWGFRGIDRVYMQSYLGPLWNVGEWERTS
ncbi:peptide/nickel transport system substrate-binding protein [Amycolatopsis arida]|uniref:Peptide/nickel transport system substrate-binding protein n=1 Tax=Amycolatopsis arida TaxID=587909 RepID=A0A1I5PME9_9PSEU|nr:ABC transporter family substrate-binding protein [Amycolatopsis arida]TDX98545.1 peptide/nickel transport system substrate-binding protein [Amycolatopsis arida]SFP35239.1 peptide/nickel transport system substrate-binding protein [Amycolatopsis arida]